MTRQAKKPRSGELVILGASTGGPRAVQSVLEGLPASFDAAILVALHMPAGFIGPYAERLDRVSRLQVTEARDGDLLVPGYAGILPGGCQAAVIREARGPALALRPAKPDELYAPSVDPIMRSAAAVLGTAVVGVILTGMGRDGSGGLAAIRAAGGFTLAESPESAVIYGMPGQAVRSGAAARTIRLDAIPGALVARCGLRALPPDDRRSGGNRGV